MKYLLQSLIFAVLLFFTVPADAQTSVADQDFLANATTGGLAEIELGQLAMQRALREDVREFGRWMVRDHSQLNDNIKTLASQKGVTLPAAIDARHKALVEKLASLTGTEFDNAYIDEMIKDHQEDLKDFKAASANTIDPDMKAFLAKAVPIIEKHLQHVSALSK